MRRLTISGKEYTIEFSIEASLYNECTEATMDMIFAIGEARGQAESIDENDNAQEAYMSVMRKTIMSVSHIPQTATTLFYAGLLEHHGQTGDNTVCSIEDAKVLIKAYIRENKTNFYEIMNLMLQCMGEDHFFDLTGLSSFLNPEEDVESKKKPAKKRKVGVE